MTTFYQYLMRLGEDEDDGIRDLAYELELDRNFPRGSSNQSVIRAYVLKKYGVQHASSFDRVWDRFVKATKR